MSSMSTDEGVLEAPVNVRWLGPKEAGSRPQGPSAHLPQPPPRPLPPGVQCWQEPRALSL